MALKGGRHIFIETELLNGPWGVACLLGFCYGPEAAWKARTVGRCATVGRSVGPSLPHEKHVSSEV